jgi:hypothetical protein
MTDQLRRYHYALGLEKVRGGWKARAVIERPSRAEADKTSLSLVAHHDQAVAITIDREIHYGDLLDAKTLGMPGR